MIKSVIWASMLDYPGHVCTTIFFDKCNFNCEYCHNQDLEKMKEIDFVKEILPKMIDRKGMVNHVILSGGECTIDENLQEILNILYEKEFKIGIHTNGYKPEFLEKNIKKISFIGMDIKNDLEKEQYKETVGLKIIDINKIKKSVELIIKNSENKNLEDYEFRTTIYPKYLNIEGCINIAKYLKQKNAKKYTLQQYNKVEGLSVIPFSEEKLNNIKNECNKYINTQLRGI